MCLEKDKKGIRKSIKPKFVYVVRKIEKDKILSPFETNFQWEVGKIHTAKYDEKWEHKYSENNFNYSNLIFSGYFHALLSYKMAEKMKNKMWSNGNYKIFFAEIPAETYFCEGKMIQTAESFNGKKAIAAQRLKLIKEVI